MADLREDNPEKCVIVGTTFVQQKLKPSILREISEETQLAPQPIRQNFADESDTLILEDEVQRIQLLGDFPVDQFVTGVVMAVLGKLVEFGLELAKKIEGTNKMKLLHNNCAFSL